MSHFRCAPLLSLLLLGVAVASVTITLTDTNGGKCRVKTLSHFTVSTTYTYNGNTYTTSETFNEPRGVSCIQGNTKKCKSTYMEVHSLPYGNGNTNFGGLTAKICQPTTTANITRSRTLYPDGNAVTVNFRWSNITVCSCRFAWKTHS